MTDEPVSAQTVSQLTRCLDEPVRGFHRARLEDDPAYLFLDGVWLKVRQARGPGLKGTRPGGSTPSADLDRWVCGISGGTGNSLSGSVASALLGAQDAQHFGAYSPAGL